LGWKGKTTSLSYLLRFFESLETVTLESPSMEPPVISAI